MSFILSNEQEMVRGSTRQMAAAISLRTARELLAAEPKVAYGPETLRHVTDSGLGGVLVPEEFGGAALDMMTAALAARELGRKLVTSPLLGATVTACTLGRFGKRDLSRDWLSRIAQGDCIVGLALENHDHPTVQISPQGKLSGKAEWAVDTASADALLVAAATPNGRTLVFAPVGTGEVSRVATRMADGRLLTAVNFENFALADSVDLGEDALDMAFKVACVWLAANTCGTVEEIFGRTVEYLRERKQFDRSLASFQALQHRLAQMHCDLEDAWSATQRAAIALDAGDPRAKLYVAVAKAKTSDVASNAVAECLQLHGGIGMTEEHDVGLYLKAARLSSELLGGYTYHADKVASELGY